VFKDVQGKKTRISSRSSCKSASTEVSMAEKKLWSTLWSREGSPSLRAEYAGACRKAKKLITLEFPWTKAER
jgi:hypothetical protein